MVLLKIGYETIRKSCNPECVIKNRRKGILATQIRYFGRDFFVSRVSRYGNILCTFFFRRNRRRRAKALLDFERHDDDELGFRKNDIVTVRSDTTIKYFHKLYPMM